MSLSGRSVPIVDLTLRVRRTLTWSVRLTCVACCLASMTPAFAADLSKVDRAIVREPTYTGKPEYCLLVFGPQAADRVWLVRDRDVLWADKNGNGNLTEPGEQIAAEHDSGDLVFHVGTVRLGKLEHRHLKVRASKLSGYGESTRSHPVAKAALERNRDADLMSVQAEIEVPEQKGSGDDGRLIAYARSDAGGPLLFGRTPVEAPVLHLGGPLQLGAEAARPTLHRNVVHDLMLVVGTPGVGPGTFVTIAYDQLIPKEAFVVVDAEFPASPPGTPPVTRRFELKERC